MIDEENESVDEVMVGRMWDGGIEQEETKTYEEMLREDILPGIARRNIKDYGGAKLLIRDERDEAKFVTCCGLI